MITKALPALQVPSGVFHDLGVASDLANIVVRSWASPDPTSNERWATFIGLGAPSALVLASKTLAAEQYAAAQRTPRS